MDSTFLSSHVFSGSMSFAIQSATAFVNFLYSADVVLIIVERARLL